MSPKRNSIFSTSHSATMHEEFKEDLWKRPLSKGMDITQHMTHTIIRWRVTNRRLKKKKQGKNKTDGTYTVTTATDATTRPSSRLSRCRWCLQWCSWTWTLRSPSMCPWRWRWCRLPHLPSHCTNSICGTDGCDCSRQKWTAEPCENVCSWSSKWWGWHRPTCRTGGGWKRWVLLRGLWWQTSCQRLSRYWLWTRASSRWRRVLRSPSACGWRAS